ncbi:hypothetical protein PPYR_00639 [Photinus pyralis]|uniref:Ionotropic glutamate receptor C-terminal domain-containing protein n=1 Tax=Photinus pyralis TaxID=7054 RepID=A0A5N4B233_PHOPY|nr:hypothetical protein PPYR_00639 [Photinus pyralis]
MSSTRSWGYLLPNGEVDGLPKVLHEKRADFSHSIIIFKPYRLKVMDYGHGSWIMSTRMVTFTVLIFFFMVYQFYSCSIVSNLLLEPPRTIKTLEDLLKSKLEVGCEDTQYDRNYFAHNSCASSVIFNCDSKRDRVNLIKFFSLNNRRVALYDVADHNLTLSGVFFRDQSNLAVVVNGDCEETETFLQHCGKLDLFSHTYHWLVLGSHRDVIGKFENVDMFINADISVAISDEGKSKHTIFDVYNPAYKRGGNLVVSEVGCYTEEDGYKVQVKDIKYYRRRNMTGTMLKSVMVVPGRISTSLAEYLTNDEDRKNNTFSRFQNVVLHNCQEFFDYDVNMSLMASWGYLRPDGDVDGMLKEIKEKRIDFGNAPLLFKLYRLKIMDYGFGSWVMKSAFFFQHPKDTATSAEMYLHPLDSNVWFGILFIMALIIVILRVSLLHESNVLTQTEEETASDRSWTVLIIYTIGELGQQGFTNLPIIASTRIVTLTVLIFFFMVYQFYSCSIVSNLLLERPRTINTLEDLVNSKLGAGCEDSLYDKDYIATTTDPVALRLYDTKIKGPHNTTRFLPAHAGMDKVKAGGFAFHTQTSTAYPIIGAEFPEEAICQLAEVKMYATQTMYIPLPKRSPLKEMFNYCLAHQTEVGVMERLRNHWAARKPQCRDKTPYRKIEVGLDESYWALLVLGAGVFFGLLILSGEYCLKKVPFIFRHPRSTASSSKIYLQPLETNVWIGILLVIVLIIFILRITLVHEHKILRQRSKQGVQDRSWTMLFIYCIGELGQQGFSNLPTIASTRMVTFTVLIFFFMVYQFYSCSIVSNLLLEPPRTIKTLEDLLKSKLEVGCEDTQYDRNYFSTTTNPVAISLYNTKMKGSHNATNFFSAQVGMDKVKAGGFAFHSVTTTAYSIIETQFPEEAICQLAEIQMYAIETLYMTLPKGSPLKEMLNYCSVHQSEVGVMYRVKSYWDSCKPNCRDSTPYLKIEVGIEESYWALIVLGVGLVLALLFLVAEHGWKRWGHCVREKFSKRAFK